MPKAIRGTTEMIAAMTPRLVACEFVYCTTQDAALISRVQTDALATFHEAEGLSLVVPRDCAENHGFDCGQVMRCITLDVHSALDGVGLTAAVATALGQQGIPCNMVAAYHHDHVFVPSTLAERAVETLRALQAEAAKAGNHGSV